MPAPRKFKVGDSVWQQRFYGKREYQESRVVGVEGRSYLIALISKGEPIRPEKISFNKAEYSYRTTAERDDLIWLEKHRREIHSRLDQVFFSNDVATLKRVAEALGYEETT